MTLNLLHVVPSYYPAFVYGGPIFSIHYLCEGLSKHNVQVSVLTTDAKDQKGLMFQLPDRQNFPIIIL